jgi:predicted Rossmann-fold nucleotide-binding protein
LVERRNLIIVLTADALIAVDGGYGTLSEIGFALAYAKPVVGLSTWSISRDRLEDIPISKSEDAVEAVELAAQAADERQRAALK